MYAIESYPYSGRHEKGAFRETSKSKFACVCIVDETKKTLEVNKVEGFSKLHNIQFEEKAIRLWRSYGVGRGKEVSFDELVSLSQGNTGLVVSEEFFDCRYTRM